MAKILIIGHVKGQHKIPPPTVNLNLTGKTDIVVRALTWVSKAYCIAFMLLPHVQMIKIAEKCAPSIGWRLGGAAYWASIAKAVLDSVDILRKLSSPEYCTSK
jgi:hypothetical protein